MRVGNEFVRRVGNVSLGKKCIAMSGFISILDNHIASMRGKLFELMDGLVGRV